MEKHPYPVNPVRIIHLSGTDREMGREHASLLGSSVTKGMPHFYLDFWNRMLKTEPKKFWERTGSRVAKALVEKVAVKNLLNQVPPWAVERMSGISDVSQIPLPDLLRTLILPDLLPMLQAYLARLMPSTFIDVRLPTFGCSSFVSKGKHFLHGRNLDFPGVAYWDRYPVVQVTSHPGKLRFVSFTSAGVPFGGITGINEAKISVSLHQHYCRESSLNGILPFFVSEEILSNAKSLEEAVTILRKYKVATAWAFVMSDGKTREAMVYETHPKAGEANFLGKRTLTHSNFFQTPACQPQEYATTARMNWDNYCRKSRLEELVEKEDGELTPERATQIISDHFDPFWNEEKYVNRTVSQVYNIQSVVFDPENMVAWAAEGNAPIHLRRYRKYELGALLSGKTQLEETFLPSYEFKNERIKEAKERYILSFVAGFDGQFDEALSELEKAIDAHYCPEAALVKGIILLKQGEFLRGGDELLNAKAWIETKSKTHTEGRVPPEYFEICLYAARTMDLLGKETEARSLYHLISNDKRLEDRNIGRLSQKTKPFSRDRLDRIFMPYSTYIPFS